MPKITTYGITLDTDGTYYGWRSTDTVGPEGELDDRDYASYGTEADSVTDAYTELVDAGFLPAGHLVDVSGDYPDEEQVWEVQMPKDWTEHIGPTHDDGSPHVPDWTTVTHADVDPRRPIFDIWCTECGQSGSFGLTPTDIQWV